MNCEKEDGIEQQTDAETINEKVNNTETVSFEDAINYFNIKNQTNKLENLQKKSSQLTLNPDWNSLDKAQLPITNALLTSTQISVNRKGNYNSKLFFMKIDGEMKNVIYTIYKDSIDEEGNIINARFFLNKPNGDYIDGYIIENGAILKQYKINDNAANKNLYYSRSSRTNWNTEKISSSKRERLPGFSVIFKRHDTGTHSSTSKAFYSSGNGATNGYGTTNSNYNVNYNKLTNKNVEDMAGTIFVKPSFYDEELSNCPQGMFPDENGDCVTDLDEQIIDSLTGKAKCVLNKLKKLNLFKTTIGEFANDDYNLTFTNSGICNKNPSEEACTDPEDLSNGNITIRILGSATNSNKLDYAATILHEGIHASIYRYVNRYKKGLDPNNRANIFYYYKIFKAQNSNDFGTAIAQHQYMQDAYVIPIAKAIRKLDGNRFPLEDYYGFGWEGTRKYAYEDYIDVNGKIQTMTPAQYRDLIKIKDEIVGSSIFAQDCK